jgi:hypothetical protein
MCSNCEQLEWSSFVVAHPNPVVLMIGSNDVRFAFRVQLKHWSADIVQIEWDIRRKLTCNNMRENIISSMLLTSLFYINVCLSMTRFYWWWKYFCRQYFLTKNLAHIFAFVRIKVFSSIHTDIWRFGVCEMKKRQYDEWIELKSGILYIVKERNFIFLPLVLSAIWR